MSSYELVVQVRDHQGNPTGKLKNFSTDDASELESIWNRNSGFSKKTQQKKSKNRSKKSLKDKIIGELEQLTKLEKGWDGKNSPPFNYQTFLMSQDFVGAISDLIKEKPNIVPLPGGAAQIEFRATKNNKELEIEFNDRETITYLFWDPDNNFSEEKSIGSTEVWKIRELLQILNKK